MFGVKTLTVMETTFERSGKTRCKEYHTTQYTANPIYINVIIIGNNKSLLLRTLTLFHNMQFNVKINNDPIFNMLCDPMHHWWKTPELKQSLYTFYNIKICIESVYIKALKSS